MKRIITSVLGLLLSVTVVMGVSAAGNSLNCTASADTLKIGDTVTVKVSMTNSDAFKSMGLSFEYNRDVFSLKSGKWLFSGAMIADVDKEKNKAAATFKDSVTQNGEIFELVLEVKSNAATGKYEVKFDPRMKNPDSQAEDIAVIGTSVTLNVNGKTQTDASGGGTTSGSAEQSRPNDATESDVSSNSASSGNGSVNDVSQPDASDTSSNITSSESTSTENTSSGNIVDNDKNNANDNKKSSDAVLWIVLAVSSAVAIGVAVLIIVKRKRTSK